MAHMRMDRGIYAREDPAPVAAAPYWPISRQPDGWNHSTAFDWISGSPHYKDRPADPTLLSCRIVLQAWRPWLWEKCCVIFSMFVPDRPGCFTQTLHMSLLMLKLINKNRITNRKAYNKIQETLILFYSLHLILKTVFIFIYNWFYQVLSIIHLILFHIFQYKINQLIFIQITPPICYHQTEFQAFHWIYMDLPVSYFSLRLYYKMCICS